MKPRIIIIESDTTRSLVMSYNLQSEGYDVQTISGEEVLQQAITIAKPDLLVLGSMCSQTPKIVFCQRLQKQPATRDLPLLMVASAEEATHKCCLNTSKIKGYIIAPFSMSEFIERVKTLLRHSVRTLMADELVLDRDYYHAVRFGRELRLAPTEYRMLELFMQYPGKIFSRSELRMQLGESFSKISDRSIDVYIGRLRKALIRGKESDPIRTVRGGGYGLNSGSSRSLMLSNPSVQKKV